MWQAQSPYGEPGQAGNVSTRHASITTDQIHEPRVPPLPSATDLTPTRSLGSRVASFRARYSSACARPLSACRRWWWR